MSRTSTLTSVVCMFAASAGLAIGTASAQPVSPEAQPLQTSPDKIGPRLGFEPSLADFGQIDDSKKVTKTVTLTNTGDEVLRIPEEGGLKGSCGCTVPEVPQYALEPGESMEIEVTFDPRNRQGKQAKTITIQTNSLNGAPTVIPVEAMIIQRVQFVEGVANLGRVDQGDSAEMLVRVRGMDTEFAVLAAETSRPDALTVEVLETTVAERDDLIEGQMVEVGETILKVTLLSGAPVGRLSAQLNIETNDASVTEHKTQVITDVVGDLRLNATNMRLGVLQPGNSFENSLEIHSNKGNPFNIEKIVFISSDLSPEDRAKITTEYAPLEDESGRVGYTVTIKGDVTDTMRLIRGRVVIMTDRGGQKVVTANIAGVVRPTQG